MSRAGNARCFSAIERITGMPMPANSLAAPDPAAEREALVEMFGEDGAEEVLGAMVGAIGWPKEGE